VRHPTRGGCVAATQESHPGRGVQVGWGEDNWAPLLLVHGRTHTVPPYINLAAAPFTGPLCPAAAASPSAANVTAAMQRMHMQAAHQGVYPTTTPPAWLPEPSQVRALFTFPLTQPPSPRTDNSPQRKEARPLSHALASD
jgi:hypothetical protein